MADFDSFNYDIVSRLPEWWKGFGLLEPVNKYTQDLIAKILQALLTTMGVVQPLNCWLTIPEEYTWYHHYKPVDGYLKDAVGENYAKNQYIEITDNAVTTLFQENEIHAVIPNTKRNCHAKIQLKLLGTELKKDSNNDIQANLSDKEIIEKLVISNANQKIVLYDIPSTSTIEILTKEKRILVDGAEGDYLIEGEINKIKPVQKNSETLTLDIEDENKKTELVLDSTQTVDFDLQIYLYKPTYTTEQNIQIATVSAFPIEWVRLFGYFCHPFNGKSGYKCVFEKKYTQESRTVFDRISTQFDCETFYIQVKFHGIETPLEKGFPQQYAATKAAFQLNPMLDKWGKIYGMPRRNYKPDITEDEEPYTFPKYYKYPVEQDYWYEKRMIEEYRYDDEAVNSLFVRDDEFNNIGMLECIYPFMNEIFVYTETIDPSSMTLQKVQNQDTDYVPLCSVQEISGDGQSWNNPENLVNKPITIKLNPQSNDIKKLNDFSYQTKKLKLSFCLNDFKETTPKDIIIKGIELKFKTQTSVQSRTIKLHEDSVMILPYKRPDIGVYSEDDKEYIPEKINIYTDNQTWLQEKEYYKIGGENNLFQQEKITKDQLFEGNDGKVEFELAFINENRFLESQLYLENAHLNIYYEIIPSKYSIDVKFDTHEINLRENNDHRIRMAISVKNESKIKIHDKDIMIIIPPELQLQNETNGFKIDLDIDEEFTIGDFEDENVPLNEQIIIKPKVFEDGIKTGWYDILVICEDKIISNEILIRGNT